MLNTAETTIHEKRPGIVRRFWWRTSQQARFATACLGVLTALAVTGVAGFGGEALREERVGGSEAAAHRGDSFEVTVHTVSEVDSFEGVEPATGLSFDARVAGLSPTADCWAAESRSVAQNLLRGQNVRLLVRKDGDYGNGRLVVDVRLPDGTDYAQRIVDEGVATADLSARGELAQVESAARRERRGLWAAGCAYQDDAPLTTSSASPSSSSAPAPTTTTTTATTTTTTTTTETSQEEEEPTSSSRATSTSAPSTDEWVDRMVGRRCYFEGARRTSPKGNEVVCGRNGKGQLRWRRAD